MLKIDLKYRRVSRSITEPAGQDKLEKIIAKIDNLRQHVEEIQKWNVDAVSVPENVKDSTREIQNVILEARLLKELETLGFEYNALIIRLRCTYRRVESQVF